MTMTTITVYVPGEHFGTVIQHAGVPSSTFASGSGKHVLTYEANNIGECIALMGRIARAIASVEGVVLHSSSDICNAQVLVRA